MSFRIKLDLNVNTTSTHQEMARRNGENPTLSELTADILKTIAAKLSPDDLLTAQQHAQPNNQYWQRTAKPKAPQNFQRNHQQQHETKSKKVNNQRTFHNINNAGGNQTKASPVQFNHQPQQHPNMVKPRAVIGKQSPKELAVSKIRSNEKIIILMRGCPGSGKSTLARQLQHRGVILSADDYFYRNGRYEFDPSRLSEAHEQTKKGCLRAIMSNRTPIIIDNTNLEAWEMIPYVTMGLKHAYFITLLEPETPWRYNAAQLAAKNTHNVNINRIVRMLEVFDRNLTAYHLIKCCKGSQNSDSKPFRGTPQPSPVKQSPQKRPSKPRTHRASESSSHPSQFQHFQQPPAMPPPPSLITQQEQLQKNEDEENEEDDGWSSNEEEWEPQQNLQALRSKSVPDQLNRLESLSIRPQSPFVPVKDSSPSFSPPQKHTSHVTDLLDLDFSYPPPPSSSSHAFLGKSGDRGPIQKPTSSVAAQTLPTPGASQDQREENSNPEDPLKVLKSFFSTVPDDALTDFYEKCNGDLHWVVNLLLDDGYEMSVPQSVTQNLAEADEQDKTPDLIDLSAFSNESNQREKEQQMMMVPVISVTDEDQQLQPQASGTSNSTMGFQLRLDAGFAKQLQDTFGPVGYNLSSDSYSASELDVTIPVELAAQIHGCWSASLCDKFNQEDVELVQMLTDEDYAKLIEEEENAELTRQEEFARRLQLEEHVMSAGFYPQGNLNEFPTLEPKNEAQFPPQDRRSSSQLWTSPNSEDLAIIIKRKQLYEQFPNIDRQAIESVYATNNYRYEETLNTLKLIYEPSELPEHVIAPEFSQEYENYLLQRFLLMQDEERYLEDERTRAEEEPSFTQLRDRAQHLLGLRKEYFEKAKTAFQNNQKTVASYYSQKGHRYTAEIQAANKRAVEMIMEITNSSHNANTLDLHLLTTREAMNTLVDFLNLKQMELEASDGGTLSMAVYIITGKGNHSQEGVGRIREAVSSYLKTKNYSFYQVNAGCVEVLLRKIN